MNYIHAYTCASYISPSPSPSQALENRTAESRREMDVLDALEEIRDWNARNASGDCRCRSCDYHVNYCDLQ